MNNLSEVLEIKKCNRCKTEKPTCEFYTSSKWCKACWKQHYTENKDRISKKQKEYRENNPEKVKESLERCKKNNAESIKASKIKYNHKNREKLNAWHKIDREKNKQKYSEDQKKYYKENGAAHEAKLARGREWKKNNKERIKKTKAEWLKNNKGKREKWLLENKDILREKRRIRNKKRRHTDKIYKNILMLRNGTSRALKYGSKPEGTLKLLGCEPEFLVKYIENKFQEGMNWDNWSNGEGKWNLDHILPLDSFDFSKSESWKICFHYTNLQPLWWRDNNTKSNKLDWQPKNKKESNGMD